ncbi:MAG: DUF3160 domain-containing protein [Chloroflexia bacterium]
MEKRFRFLGLLVLAGLLASCGPGRTPVPTSVPTAATAPTATTGLATTAAPVTQPPIPPTQPPVRFASYRKPAVSVRPAVSHAVIAPDLSNVRSTFLLSAAQRAMLARNGFVVSPSEEKEFYTLYEKARYAYEPIFVTSDSLLHVYHLLFDKVLRTLEQERFIPALRALNARMLEEVRAQYQALRGTALEESARRNMAFFAVGSRLLDPGTPLPPEGADLAQAELALIEAHNGVYPSPLFPALPVGEDYTQYIPRGHYTRNEALQAYFRAMMWYGRMTFRILKPDDPNGREETRRALLIVQALATDPEAGALWQSIYEPTVFFVGRSDDLLYTEYLEVMERVYGGIPEPAALLDEGKLTAFMEAAQQLRPPRILGIVLTGREDKEQATKGFRFMGQRFVPDSYIFGQLIDREVRGRPLPKGLDLFAVLGSERAYEILEAEGDTRYPRYTENLSRLRDEFAALGEEDWTQNLYWSWLYAFFPLLEEPGKGYPAFMQSRAWVDKNLNTVLGSWAELRHDTILYAKQVYAEKGGEPKGPPPEPTPPKGYVEPVPEFYARLAALAAMTHEGLAARGMLNELDGESLQRLEDLSLALKGMAEKELAREALSDEEYARIRFYGADLEQLTFAASDEYAGPGGFPTGEEEPQAAVVADVATNANLGQVLEEGVGRVHAIYVVAPIEEELVICKGGVFSYYEFPWPMEDRLTDEKWRRMLDAGQAPPLPAWTASFRVEETEEAALREAIWGFHDTCTTAFWLPDIPGLERFATGEALQLATAYVEQLRTMGEYEGRHLERIEFLSYDFEDAAHAVVTTRETWWTERFRAAADPWMPGTRIGLLPEHTIGVVYHLERIAERWCVSAMDLVEGEVPAWQEAGP